MAALALAVPLAVLLIAAGFRARRSLGACRDVHPRSEPSPLRSFLRPYRRPLVVATLLICLESVLALASPWPLKLAVDNAIGGRPLPAWLSMLRGLSPASLAAVAGATGVVLVATAAMVGYLTAYLMGATAERVGSDMRAAAFARLQRLSIRFHDRNRTGDLVARLVSDVSRVQDALVAWFQTLLPELFALLGMLAVLLAVDPQLAFAALVVVPALAALVSFTRPRIRSAQREARTLSGALASRATEVLRNVRAVQAFSRQDEEERRFRSASDRAAQAAVGAMDIGARYSPVADVVLALGTALIMWLGVRRVTSGEMTLGVLLVVLSYLSSLYGPIRSLSRLASTLAKGAASRERLTEILESPELVPEDPDPLPAPEGAPGLDVRGVVFSYREGEPVLDGVSLQVAPGETLCIVGRTGAGKSTLLSLILRFYDPNAGVIELGDVDLRRLALRSLRDRVALVPQDPWILDGSIADNIAFGRAGATPEQIGTAARLALVDEFADRLHMGLDTVVGEVGSLLSGGQRRRIALARALVRDAAILLLDEPTSGLDAASEAAVLEAIRRASLGRTVVIVSHRLNVAHAADRIAVLDGGRVVETGSPHALIASGGAYARLWGVQQGSSQDLGEGRVVELTGFVRSGRR